MIIMKKCLLILSLFLSLSVFADTGDTFDNPIVIDSAGTITFPEGKDNLYYSYTLTDSAVIILSEHADYNTIVSNLDGEDVSYGYSGEQKYHLAGETYIIMVESYISGSFDWTLTQRNAILGEFNYLPIVITESGKIGMGENKKRVYYSFTPETDGVICFDNVDNIEIEVTEKDGYENLFAYNSNYRLTVLEGTTYIFFLNSLSQETFEFDFKFANEKGATCSNAIEIDGFGTVTSSIGTGTKYFKFTAPKKDLIKITTLNATSTEGAKSGVLVNSLKLYSSCGLSENSYTVWGDGANLEYEAEAGEEFIIKYNVACDDYTNDLFSFTILAKNTVGGSCAIPIQLSTAGDVNFADGEKEQYYTYTATKDCKLLISDSDTNEFNVSMFLSCNQSGYSQISYDGEMFILANAGIPYILKWESAYDTNAAFTWSLTEEDYLLGETCKNPIAVELGTVDFDFEYGKQYYSYTASKSGIMEVSDASFRNIVNIFTNCTDESPAFYSYNGDLSFACEKDVTYIFEWENDINEIFSWAFSIRDADLGETCANPIIIPIIGDANSPTELELPNTAQYVFYSYTATTNQVLTLSDAAKSCKIGIATDCSFDYATYDSQGELNYEVISGKTYIIRWKQNYQSTIPWTIHARDVIPGESMMSAIKIDNAGDVKYPADLEKVYYSYTPTSKVAIRAVSAENGPYTSFTETFLDANELEYITWFNKDETAFTWTLSERDILEGETCTTPIAINTIGDIVCSASLTNTYYSFTATKNSILTITDKALEHSIYLTNGCNYTNYYSNSKGEIAAEVEAGDAMIIEWRNNGNDEFTWTISEAAPLAGETLENAIVIDGTKAVIVNGLEKGLVRNYYSYTATEDQKIELTEGDFVMILDGATKDTLIETYNSITEFNGVKDKTYIIVWGSGYNNYTAFSLTTKTVGASTVLFNVSDGYDVVKDATITIDGNNLKTDNNGKTTIALASGTYAYTISAYSFVQQSGEITISGSDYNITAVLSVSDEETHKITFNFTDVNGPVSNAFVYINNKTISADSETSIRIDLIDGTYAYTASTLYHGDTEGEVAVAGADQEVNVLLVAGETEKHTLKFIIDDGTNDIKDATISINDTTLTSDENGEATVNLTDGGYAYEITANGYTSKTGTIYVSGKDLNEMVTLSPASAEKYQLSFTITGNSTAIEGATVVINDSTIISNNEGIAGIELQNGTYSYTVSATGYQAYTQQTTINNANTNISVALIAEGEETFTITFNVEDFNGAINGATISINNTTIETNTDGIATITLTNGNYSYTITTDNCEEYSGEIVLNGANEDIPVTLTNLVGINDFKKALVNVYPNPCAGVLHISSSEAIKTITLFTFDGKQIITLSNSTTLNLEDSKDGVYVMLINFGEYSITKHVIKQ